jgi:hypothetical protein
MASTSVALEFPDRPDWRSRLPEGLGAALERGLGDVASLEADLDRIRAQTENYDRENLIDLSQAAFELRFLPERLRRDIGHTLACLDDPATRLHGVIEEEDHPLLEPFDWIGDVLGVLQEENRELRCVENEYLMGPRIAEVEGVKDRTARIRGVFQGWVAFSNAVATGGGYSGSE